MPGPEKLPSYCWLGILSSHLHRDGKHFYTIYRATYIYYNHVQVVSNAGAAVEVRHSQLASGKGVFACRVRANTPDYLPVQTIYVDSKCQGSMSACSQCGACIS